MARANPELFLSHAWAEEGGDTTNPIRFVRRIENEQHRIGCGLCQCGACTVIINGVATRSCITPTSSSKGEITTLEGIAKGGKLHPLQQAWIDEQVPQCSSYQDGQIMTANALLDKNPHATDAQIREGMNQVLCRCMTYYRVQAGIKRGAKMIADARVAPEKEMVA